MFHDAKFGCRIGAFLGLAVWTMSSGAALGQTVQREYLAHPDNDKEKIELFWTKPDGPGPWPAVVFIHGHQTNRIGGMVYVEVGRLRRTVERGFVAAAVSQPGYGNSSGPPDFSGPFSQSAVLKAIEFLRAKPFVKPDKIGLVGGSRGAIVASMVGTKDSRLAAVVLVSGIYDLEKGYPTGRSGLDDNIAKEAGTSKAAFRARSAMHHADKIRMPVLLLHGADDWFDFLLVERFAEILKANGTWVRLKVFADTGHLIPYDKQYEEIYPFLEWHLRSANIGVKGDAEPPKPQILTPRSDIKGILRAKGLSDLEAFQEAKNYIGTKCLDNFERSEKRHSSGFETAFAYAQERLGDRYACGGSYSTFVEAAKYRALYKCERAREKHGVNAPCEILAIGNKIVWEGKTVRSK